jgi:hypothetical protein
MLSARNLGLNEFKILSVQEFCKFTMSQAASDFILREQELSLLVI